MVTVAVGAITDELLSRALGDNGGGDENTTRVGVAETTTAIASSLNSHIES